MVKMVDMIHYRSLDDVFDHDRIIVAPTIPIILFILCCTNAVYSMLFIGMITLIDVFICYVTEQEHVTFYKKSPQTYHDVLMTAIRFQTYFKYKTCQLPVYKYNNDLAEYIEYKCELFIYKNNGSCVSKLVTIIYRLGLTRQLMVSESKLNNTKFKYDTQFTTDAVFV